ncbi:complement C3-like [Lytechinus pictus]|uniref:complement C3-like n=1 Tax=Lytechinus pictus TaxID=7653 RepID=UPI0030B9D9D4
MGLVALFFVLSISASLIPGGITNSAFFMVTSPNVFRVGVPEKVLVTRVRGGGNNDISVKVSLSKPGSTDEPFSHETRSVGEASSVEFEVVVRPEDLVNNEGEFQHMVLKAECPDDISILNKETEVLVTLQSGYVFVQTDKPIYTPNQNVMIKVMSLDQDMRPSDREIHVEIINPNGISVKQLGRTHAESNGFLSGEYTFHDHPTLGIWNVTAFYGPDLNNRALKYRVKSSVTFEVKEYVLPTFSVKVETPAYILDGADSVVSTINAQYVFGKPVIGRYVFKYGILQDDGSVEELGERNGHLNEEGSSQITLHNLATDFGTASWFDQYKGRRFHAKAIVRETATQFTEAGISTSTVFESSPYRFSTERTVQYFKAGLNLQIKLDLTFVNGDVAPDVPVQIQAYGTDTNGDESELPVVNQGANAVIPNTDEHGGIQTSRDIQSNVVSVRVVASTVSGDYNPENQASISFEVTGSDPENGEFILIRPQNADDRKLVVGRNTEFLIQRVGSSGVPPNTNLHYLCITGGRIVESNFQPGMPDVGTSLQITITSDMAPQMRLIVYYMTATGRVIADSLRLGVEEKCRQNPPLSLRILPEPPPPLLSIYDPHSMIEVEITAPNDSSIGLLAVDKAVYLLRDKDRMNNRKMYNRMKSYDTGCGPGGGFDTSQIFKDSGMTVLTNGNLEVGVRASIGCEEEANRRRRSIVPGEICYSVYESSCLATRIRLKRMLSSTDYATYPCSRRARILASQCGLTPEQKTRFEVCCENPPIPRVTSETSRSGGNNNQIDGVKVRDDFRETWLFDVFPMPTNGDKMLHPLTTPSSITEWHLTAVSLSQTQGMCIEDDTTVMVYQKFFIQLHLPYSVVRLEQTQILVTIFNYGISLAEVTVWFSVEEGLCTAENPAMRMVSVESKNAASVAFIVRPVDVGTFDIRVNASANGKQDNGKQDSVKKSLLVVPTGVLTRKSRSVTLNPGGVMFTDDVTTPAPNNSLGQVVSIHNNQTNNQVDLIPISLPVDSIPETESCSVKLIGTLLGTIATDPIQGVENLVQQPTGCGEQTMIRLAPTLFVYKYLQAVGEDTGDQEELLTEYIKNGVAREITYRQHNGAYAAWTNRAGSTWLTAFVVKIFSQAKQFNALNDESHVEGSVNWLIDENQQVGGEFHENNQVIHQEMIGAVKGDTSRTAFVLISLLEGRNLLDSLKNEKINNSISLAIQFLHNQLENGLPRMYDKAIVTYALAMAKSTRARDLNNDLWAHKEEDDTGAVFFPLDSSRYEYIGNRPMWRRIPTSSIDVETAGYALLAQLALHQYQNAGRVALWLSKQQDYGGGFVSTQDTVVALQALSKYAERPQFSNINMDCTLSTGGDILKRHVIENHNAKIQEEVKVSQSIGHDLQINSVGEGVALANVELRYNTEKSDLDTCPFHLNITAAELPSQANNGQNLEGLRITVCTRFTGEGNTHMSILDVGLYSGFKAVEDTKSGLTGLKELINGSDSISSYEAGQRSVIFYLDEIPKTSDLCFTFYAETEVVVGNVQAAAVHVYDYYDPDLSCTIFYKPGTGSSLLNTLCSENECICSGGSLKFCNPTDRCPRLYSASELEATACQSHSSYALKIHIEQEQVIGGFRVYNFTVKKQIKRGDENIPLNGMRQLYVNEGCKCPKIGQRSIPGDFLLVGRESLKYTTKDGVERYRYLYGKFSKMVLYPRQSLVRNLDIRQALSTFETSMDEATACSGES